MATVIDSLIMQVGFDTSGVKKGQEEANKALKDVKDNATSTAKEMQSRGSQAGEFFGSITGKILGATAALLGFEGVKHAITETVTSVAALGRVAAVTGANVKELSAFAMAIERNGGNAAAATQEVEGFIAAVTKWQTLGEGSKELSMFYGTIGAGMNTSWLDALKLYAEYADKHKDNPASVRQLGAGVGLSDTTISELMKGGAGFSADLEKSRKLGIATPEDAEAARKLQESLAGLTQATDTFWRLIVTQWTPALVRVFDWVTSVLPNKAPDVRSYMGGMYDLPIDQMGNPIPGGKLPELPPGVGGTSPTAPPAQAQPSSLLDLFRKLEGSGDDAVSSKGAIGRYQVTAATAETYGFDPSRLKDPAYNEQVASAILADLSKRYGGDKDAMAIAYHSGPGAADKWIAGGKNDAMLGPRTRDYLTRERAYTGGGTTTIHTGPVTVNTQAKDAKGIARDLGGALAAQANTGLQ